MMETMYCYRPEGKMPVKMDICDQCGSEINEGDDYYSIEHLSICYECIDEFKSVAGED